MKVYAWLIDFAHFRENCPTGIIPEWMQKVTQHNGMIQYHQVRYGVGHYSGYPKIIDKNTSNLFLHVDPMYNNDVFFRIWLKFFGGTREHELWSLRNILSNV